MHSISVYLIKKSELRDDKINEVLFSEKSDINWTEMNSDILATTHIPNIRDFGKDKTIIKVVTDYFGGIGEQSAKLFINNKRILDLNSELGDSSPINSVLKQIGIDRKDGLDEFDTIGLGNYRTNSDFK